MIETDIKPIVTSIAHVFENQVECFPNAMAVIDKGKKYTYQELNTLVNQIALTLKQQGVTSGMHVGVCQVRSIEMIASLIAIVKLGATYVPLAPDFPEKRIEKICQQAKVAFVVTDNDAKHKVPNHLESFAVCQSNFDLNKTDVDFSADESGANPAYIMFTSGTTGESKAIAVSQTSIVRLVVNNNYCKIGSKDVLLQLSPFEFDGATFEIWGALLNGAGVALMPPGYPTLAEISRQIIHNSVSVLFITTRLFNAMVENRLDALLQVNQILFGGEVASVQHVGKFINESNQPGQITNIYGPTECVVFSSFYRITHQLAYYKELNGIPIGEAVCGKEFLVVDNDNNECRQGELLIAGEDLPTSYYADAEHNQDKFISIAGGGRREAVYYRTGDLVRVLPDGNLMFIGRKDKQIKLRGFRMSPEEIEKAACLYREVSVAAVLFKDLPSGDKSIELYIQPRGTKVSAQQLKEHLLAVLPKYMQPNNIYVLKTIPVNKNAKIDYAALVDLEGQRESKSQANSDDNSLTLNHFIESLWCEELNLDRIEHDTDFFELGGNSLKLISILDKMHNAEHFPFLKKLTVLNLFDYPTIAELVQYVQQGSNVNE